MNLNEHVLVDTTSSTYVDIFTPEEGYAIWRDDDSGNLDENGNPLCFFTQMHILKSRSVTVAPHIHAKLIEPGMDVYGSTNPPVTE